MVTAFDVDANKLIEKAAEKLRGMKLQKPEFVGQVKSGAHNQRPPEHEEFWYVRCASILRQAYVHNMVGTQKLRRHYGGRKSRGVRPERHTPAGGSTIRKAMQELEKAGLMVKEKAGRRLSAKGRQFLDSIAKEVSG
ncbi:MAG TPA: 30S ribosomal protein S19e [Chromatiaceae bacterium]|nr:30S ribosomal protein S19e [Chromatiaceae bacterium]